MTPATVLVVDRNARFLERTAAVLEEAGFRMLAARDESEARDLVVRRKPAVVLVSARLPRGGSAELCRFVRATLPETPLVLIFGKSERGSTNDQLENEADNYIVRPLKKEELLACVRDMVRIRRLQQEADRFRREAEALRGPARGGSNGGGSAGAGVGEEKTFFPFDLFKKLLFVEIKRAQRYGLPLTALLISLDGSDALLSEYGPETVTRLRDALARAIRRSIRDINLPVALRMGNLLILMPHTDAEGARAAAERVRQRIRRSSFRHDGNLVRPTLSMGGATKAPEASPSFSELITAASHALREAQRRGGDRFVLA